MQEDYINKLKTILNSPNTAEFGKLKYLTAINDESILSQFLSEIYLASVDSRSNNDLEILNEILEKWENKITSLWNGPHMRSKVQEGIPWTPVTKPISQSKIALVTTGGFYTSQQSPFETDGPENLGDWSYRAISRNIPTNTLNVSHIHYDISGPQEDINCVFPLDILSELEKSGFIGSMADTNYSFMGFIQKPNLLSETTAIEVADKLKADNVDGVLLTST